VLPPFARCFLSVSRKENLSNCTENPPDYPTGQPGPLIGHSSPRVPSLLATASRMASSDPKDSSADKPAASTEAAEQAPQQKSAPALEEDDEFEDFPVDDWTAEESEAAGGSGTTKHLWEESWDDDDTSDDFSTQLKEELKKVEASKRR